MENKCSIKECNVVCTFKANLIKQNLRQLISHSFQLFVICQLRNYCVFIHVWDADAAEGVTGLILWCSPEAHPSHFPLPSPSLHVFATWWCHSPLIPLSWRKPQGHEGRPCELALPFRMFLWNLPQPSNDHRNFLSLENRLHINSFLNPHLTVFLVFQHWSRSVLDITLSIEKTRCGHWIGRYAIF